MYDWEAPNRTYAFKSIYIFRHKVISPAEMQKNACKEVFNWEAVHFP